MTNRPFIADLERLEDEIDEALLHCPNEDSQMFVELRRRQSHLKEGNCTVPSRSAREQNPALTPSVITPRDINDLGYPRRETL